MEQGATSRANKTDYGPWTKLDDETPGSCSKKVNVEKLSLKTHGLAWRLFSASELLLGAVIVIGHNVFHVVPNEVPILVVLGLVSVRVRDGGWSAIGFRRPESWLRLVLIALAAAVLRIVLGDFVIETSGCTLVAADSPARGHGTDCR